VLCKRQRQRERERERERERGGGDGRGRRGRREEGEIVSRVASRRQRQIIRDVLGNSCVKQFGEMSLHAANEKRHALVGNEWPAVPAKE